MIAKGYRDFISSNDFSDDLNYPLLKITHELLIGPTEARQLIYYLNVSSITMYHDPSLETFQRNDANWPLIRKFDVIYMITIGLNKTSKV